MKIRRVVQGSPVASCISGGVDIGASLAKLLCPISGVAVSGLATTCESGSAGLSSILYQY